MSRGRKGRRTRAMVNVAEERIDILFEAAEREARARVFSRANRYVDLARRIGMRYNVRIPGNYKRRYCKNCFSYLVPGVNSRVRVRGKRILVFCNHCSKVNRMPISRNPPK